MKCMRFVVALACISALMSCGGERPSDSGKPSQAAPAVTPLNTTEILVGHYASLTGAQATFGNSMDEGVRLAFDEFNAKGGVQGRKIRVITEDDQSKPDEAANAVSRLLSVNHVLAVIGEASSSPTLAAAPLCQRARVPMITPSATNPAVTKVGDYIFRACFIDPYQGEAVAKYALSRLKMRRAALMIDSKADYSRGLSEVFEKTFTAGGGKIVASQSYQGGDSDFRPQLTAIKAAKPEIIFVPGYYGDAALVISQGRDLGLLQPFVGGDGWDSPKLVELGGKAVEGSFFSDHYYADDPSTAVQDFRSRYVARYHKQPDALAALGYDAASLLAHAFQVSEATSGPNKLRDALARTSGFSGVTGHLSFDADRNPTGKRLVFLEVRNGRFQLKDAYEPNQ